MSIILIYTLIIILIVIGLDNMIAVNEQSSSDKFIKNDIDNTFYTLDTKLNKYISECSISNLKLTNINNSYFETNCIKIPDLQKTNEIEITNENLGVYKVCYNYKYNIFSSSIINKNKEVIEENGKTCIIKYYTNELVNINLLKEISGFFNDINSLEITTLGLASDTTFIKNGKTFIKTDYVNNNLSLFDQFIEDNVLVYISNYDDNIIYYYNVNTKELYLYSNKLNISDTTKKSISYILQKISKNFIIINSNLNEPSFKIKNKE